MVDVMHLTGQSNGWRGGKEQETERRNTGRSSC